MKLKYYRDNNQEAFLVVAPIRAFCGAGRLDRLRRIAHFQAHFALLRGVTAAHSGAGRQSMGITHRYRPMLRLLSEDDLGVVRNNRKLLRKVRSERVAIFRGYVECISRLCPAAGRNRSERGSVRDRPSRSGVGRLPQSDVVRGSPVPARRDGVLLSFRNVRSGCIRSCGSDGRVAGVHQRHSQGCVAGAARRLTDSSSARLERIPDWYRIEEICV